LVEKKVARLDERTVARLVSWLVEKKDRQLALRLAEQTADL
jgi:hypothetical protein